ncbi:adenosylmethionine decarboxylase [bacterium]|nr:adenosylmethionine decarboxylase [bacterium]
MHKGKHLLIDCQDVPFELCLDDQRLLEVMSLAAKLAGTTVISQIRYKFGSDSPPGCTAMVMLDESHCSVHTYAELGLMAIDIFTCGKTDPARIWDTIRQELDIRHADVREVCRFNTTIRAMSDAAS